MKLSNGCNCQGGFSVWICGFLTGDGRCPSCQMSPAFPDTPPKRRYPLKQTWEVNHPIKDRPKRPQAPISFALTLSINYIPSDVNSSATPGLGSWGREEELSPPQPTTGKKNTRSDKNVRTTRVHLTVNRRFLHFEVLALPMSIEERCLDILCQAELSGF